MVIAFLLSLVVVGNAAAAPDESSDPVLKMLLDKGLVASVVAAPGEPAAAPVPGLLRKVQERASAMVVGAMNFIGVRYQRGGTSADTGFDCSGFTRHVFEMSLGLVLPRSADEQASAPGLVAIAREDLRPGDLVFFNTLKRTFSHVGIYIGNNRFIHSPRPGKSVRTEDMSFAYWASRFTGARRAESAAVPEQVSTAASAATSSSQ
ncbi:MAG: C40 family peptidase [Caldimonas sp.]